jgi:hypothetical protein
MKKTAFVLIIVFILLMVCLSPVLAQDTEACQATVSFYEPENYELQDGDFFYILSEDGTVTITGHTSVYKTHRDDGQPYYHPGGLTEVVIPAEIDGKLVTAIASKAFYNCSEMKSVVLPEGLLSIGQSAFRNCGLESVRIPSTVAVIDYIAFENCQNLKEVFFAGGETETVIENSAFADSGISSFFVDDNHPNLASCQGVLFDKKEKKLITYPAGNEQTSYTIPRGIRSIGEYAFYGSKLTHVDFPETLIQLDAYAFLKCKQLKKVLLPDSLQVLGSSAFAYCTDLKYVQFGSGLKEIGSGAFFACESLHTVRLPASLETIEDGVFGDCTGLKVILVSPDNPVYYAVDNVLYSDDRLIAYPAGMQRNMFRTPDSVRIIGDYAFYGAKIRKLKVSGTVREIGFYAICNMPDLESLTLEEGIQAMGTIGNNPKLTEVVIPASVTGFSHGSSDPAWPPLLKVYRGSSAAEFFESNEIPVQYVD